jgi:excisionase family DNA binding protein
MQNELLTIKELAERLKVPVSWLYSRTRVRDESTIPTVRVGKYLRFDFCQVMQWLQGKA